jgi:hypothetical protein
MIFAPGFADPWDRLSIEARLHTTSGDGRADWLRLAGSLAPLAITYALGMEAGYAKAARNGIKSIDQLAE